MTTKWPLYGKALICIAAFAVTCWIDYVSGYEISIGPVYIFLVAYTSWQFNRPAAGVAAAFVATFCHSLADFLDGLQYSHEWIRYENAATWLVVLLATAYALTSYRRTLEVHRSRLESMRRMLPVCHSCGSVRGPDGRWRTFEQLSNDPFPVVSECPDCEK